MCLFLDLLILREVKVIVLWKMCRFSVAEGRLKKPIVAEFIHSFIHSLTLFNVEKKQVLIYIDKKLKTIIIIIIPRDLAILGWHLARYRRVSWAGEAL